MKKTADDERRNFLSRFREHPGKIKAGHPTHPDVVATITAMRDTLMEKFGHDFAFSVIGGGHILAANNGALGLVSPIAEET